MKIATYRKAVLAFVLPGLGALGASMSDGNLTVGECVIAAGVALVSGVTVYSVPNAA